MDNLLTFFERWIQLKSTNQCIKAGQILCFLGFGGSGALAIVSAVKGVPLAVEWSAGNSVVLSLVAGVIGVILLVIGAFIPPQSAKSTLVTLMGIPGVSTNVPDKAVGKPYSLYNPRHYNFSLNKLDPVAMVGKLNNYCRHLVDDQIINDSKNGKVFFAGLARVPCLFAIGTMFRSSAVDVEPLERFRNPDKWARLKLFKGAENKYACDGSPQELVSSCGQIGIAISLTDEISTGQLPDDIRDHCMSIKLTPMCKREAISTLHNLHDFSKKFQKLLDECSRVANTIHLFVCAQSSAVFEMGRVYQEGMHCRVLIHNFTPGEGYTWAIEIDKGSLRYIGNSGDSLLNSS
ncbi:SAVED domain-containing protein [Gilvimarinus agarilyticus]|uniref:SAVED domain-containing protein n=1 Tax=Gilvimarinus sp. 2_MG-2023 TaxID=3062666 RepID=UPI001C0924D9|nr:SAVED domain-containing protein [Gilvimarinus sp. 2_MG-2023]MBU2886291.1 SAVED domain-containing protein [Gilvimarinus agarilyticus]MDO6570977.1 SAVED domain-containing protein [Gilvimarinus sp. 2_MG-2023]